MAKQKYVAYNSNTAHHREIMATTAAKAIELATPKIGTKKGTVRAFRV